jgi:hypothetical protein
MAAAVTPLPTELTTPPVKKIYLVAIKRILSIINDYFAQIKREVGRAFEWAPPHLLVCVWSW